MIVTVTTRKSDIWTHPPFWTSHHPRVPLRSAAIRILLGLTTSIRRR